MCTGMGHFCENVGLLYNGVTALFTDWYASVFEENAEEGVALLKRGFYLIKLLIRVCNGMYFQQIVYCVFLGLYIIHTYIHTYIYTYARTHTHTHKYMYMAVCIWLHIAAYIVG